MNLSNKYNSKVDSFTAFDMYNLPMPVLPPADLSINAGVASGLVPTFMSFRNSSGSRVVDFLPTDNPYIRGLGLTSNLADGLVDKAASHQGGSTSWRVIIRPLRISADLSGLILNTAGSATITGSGTKFTQELAPGMTISWVDNNIVQRFGTISAIASDTSLTLIAVTESTGMYAGNTGNFPITPGSKYNALVGQAGYAGNSISMAFLQMNTLYPFAFFVANASFIYTPRGHITTVAGSATVTGIGTKFLTDMVQNGNNGQNYVIGWTDDLGVRRTGNVSSITSETSLTLQDVVIANGGGTNVPMLNLDGSLRIRAEMPATFEAYTVTIDPAFGDGTRRLSIAIQAEIEHTHPMIGEL